MVGPYIVHHKFYFKFTKMHAAKAHGMKEVPLDVEKKIRANIKTVTVDVPKM
jgi:hypothetical protein